MHLSEGIASLNPRLCSVSLSGFGCMAWASVRGYRFAQPSVTQREPFRLWVVLLVPVRGYCFAQPSVTQREPFKLWGYRGLILLFHSSSFILLCCAILQNLITLSFPTTCDTCPFTVRKGTSWAAKRHETRGDSLQPPSCPSPKGGDGS